MNRLTKRRLYGRREGNGVLEYGSIGVLGFECITPRFRSTMACWATPLPCAFCESMA